MADANHPTVLWLLRHPEPDELVRGLCYGALDVGLSPRGMEQARAVASYFADEPLAAVYSSPLRRCLDAAGILAAGRSCTPIPLPALRERSLGECEGRSYEEIAARYPEFYAEWMEKPVEAVIPGGEPFADFCLRVREAVREIRLRHEGQTILLVTHAGAIRIVLADALGMAPPDIFRLGQRYGGISQVRYFAGTPVVELVNGSVIGLAR
jgi:broad specificity phosphatase PhoE